MIRNFEPPSWRYTLWLIGSIIQWGFLGALALDQPYHGDPLLAFLIVVHCLTGLLVLFPLSTAILVYIAGHGIEPEWSKKRVWKAALTSGCLCPSFVFIIPMLYWLWKKTGQMFVFVYWRRWRQLPATSGCLHEGPFRCTCLHPKI